MEVKIATYFDMDIEGNDIEGFQNFLLANGYYRAWKKGATVIHLPQQSVWKLCEAKDESTEEKTRVFKIALDEITDLCVAYNKTERVIKENASVVIKNMIILAASPWSGLCDPSLPVEKKPESFGGWPDEKTQTAYAEFKGKIKAAGLTFPEDKVIAMFKEQNNIQ